MNGYVRELSEQDKLHNEIVAVKRFLIMFPGNIYWMNRLEALELKQDELQIKRDLKWLQVFRYADLLDMSYGVLDLSQGSTREWWDSIEEEEF